ncbi:MAG: hypothetical protein HZB98_10125 [Bacteroidia bacterium]|nr:hypothetical protein [Bacteroidia bacterium]
MKRKDFLKKGLVSGAFIGSSVILPDISTEKNEQVKSSKNVNIKQVMGDPEEVVIERSVPGKPHAGKVLLAIQAHSDDIPLFAGGTVLSVPSSPDGCHPDPGS